MEAYLWNIVLTGVSGAMGILLKSTLSKIDELNKELTTVRINYAHKDDLATLREEMNHRFDKLEILINKKNA